LGSWSSAIGADGTASSGVAGSAPGAGEAAASSAAGTTRVVGSAGISASGGKIVADPVKINEYLRKETLLSTYKLIDKKNSLTIVVSEREP